MCDDFSGYKALFALAITEVGCMAHARRKFVELHVANKSSIAATALDLFAQLYQVERDVQVLTDPAAQLEQRRERAAPNAQTLHTWLIAQRAKIRAGQPLPMRWTTA